jgi:hypothetical protein
MLYGEYHHETVTYLIILDWILRRFFFVLKSKFQYRQKALDEICK